MTDLAVRLLRRGYHAIPDLRRTAGSGADAVETTVLGRRAVVVRGAAATRLFYDDTVIQREGAVPPPLANLLFGAGAVHGTDGAEHRRRKQVFLDMLSPSRVDDLAVTIGRDLERRVSGWRGRDVVVFDELVEVYGAAVQAWAGIHQGGSATRRTSRRLAAIVDGFGGAGLAYPRAWAARVWADRWARGLVTRAREPQHRAREGSILDDVATGAGASLDPRLAGVELINVLRPTIAIAWPATFLALELATAHRSDLTDDPRWQRAISHEVRRTRPFVPALAGRVRRAVTFAGVRLEPGDLVVLDVPGTNQHPSTWPDAPRFEPERFVDQEPDAYSFVPQGGGDPMPGHRCPGEPLTVRILEETTRVLGRIDFSPRDSSAADLTRIPTLPAGGLRVTVR